MRSKPTVLFLGLVFLGLAACGDGPQTEVPMDVMQGPPRWRLLQEDDPGDGAALTLQVRSPVRVRFRATRTAGEPQTTPWRVLAAGQVVRVDWEHHEEPRDVIQEEPTADDRKAGRTEAHAIRFLYHFGDRAVHMSRLSVFTRDGKGKVVVMDALPPGKYEDLPDSGQLELSTALVSDLEEGEASLRRRDMETLVVRPRAASQGDRIRVLHLFLEIAPTH